MKEFVIVTDTTTDLPRDYVEKHHLYMMSLPYTLEGTSYTWEKPMPVKDFYDKMRAGSLPTTSQANPEEAALLYESILKDNDVDILHIAFSSGLSGSFNSCRIASADVCEKYPDHRIVVVDSLAATLGQGLLVYKAVQLKEAGKSLDEVAAWVEENKYHLVHNFTVDDLFHLHRGGRLSKTAAIVGTMINLKPVLHVDDEGHLVMLSKVRGRKKSLIGLVDCMEKQLGDWKDKNDIIFISHGDCPEDAQFVADLIKERFGYENFMIDYIGATIGAHSGPGTVALFYLGDHR
ncbi:DegV family protein [Roseburia sp. OF03-24]|jgi:DegV family protein with EDD domain|uniref:DegV family protein n=1 Tax=Roseburia sp. OF03-24 TaxID=2292367 RepID=UPI000E4B5644|nr:DegV family protein [Roseburia sp. OF03-24]RGX94275.1 DegV family protein [Roseburia sp. OF03-24]